LKKSTTGKKGEKEGEGRKNKGEKKRKGRKKNLCPSTR
jgi:hypothetical protein